MAARSRRRTRHLRVVPDETWVRSLVSIFGVDREFTAREVAARGVFPQWGAGAIDDFLADLVGRTGAGRYVLRRSPFPECYWAYRIEAE